MSVSSQESERSYIYMSYGYRCCLFYDFSIRLWNCSNSVIYLCCTFYPWQNSKLLRLCILYYIILLLYIRFFNTVWYFVIFIQWLTLLGNYTGMTTMHTLTPCHIHVYINPRKLLENLKRIACGRKKTKIKEMGRIFLLNVC